MILRSVTDSQTYSWPATSRVAFACKKYHHCFTPKSQISLADYLQENLPGSHLKAAVIGSGLVVLCAAKLRVPRDVNLLGYPDVIFEDGVLPRDQSVPLHVQSLRLEDGGGALV